MSTPLPLLSPEVRAAPTAPFRGLTTLWVQLTGTWCNLECVHCINASGPTDPWLRPLDGHISVHNAIPVAMDWLRARDELL